MRAIALISFLPLATLAHPEGLWWGTDTCFNSPDNTDNECSDYQRAGFDWSDLADGAFSSYGGFDFSGFMSGIGFGGSASEGRWIWGKLSRSSATSLVISAGADVSAFSITNLQISTSIETEIYIVYGMPDGSICRDTAWCSSDPEDVSNDQCGGAISVGFELPEYSDSEDCDLGIHLIDFDCSPGPKPPGGGHDHHHPSPLPTPSPPSLPSPPVPGLPGTSTPVIPPPAIPTPVIPSQGTTPPVGPIVTPPVPTSIPGQIHPPSSSGPPSPPEDQTTTVVTYETVTTCPVTNTITSGASVTTEVSTTVSTITLTSTSTICTRCAHPPTPGVPTGVNPTSAAPPPPAHTTTVVTYETVTTCPVTKTITAGSTTSTSVYTTVSTVTLTSTNTIIHPTSAPSSPPNHPPSSPPLPPSECPTVVPKCINTWLDLPKCDSNADTACFCPSTDFTNKVISCIQAWGSSAAEIQSSLSYFTGICAAFVPTNPGIVTAVPTTITLGPVPAPKPTAVAPLPNGAPPAPAPAPAPCTTLTYSTYTVTVPQVGFSTSAGTSTTVVGLIPGPAAPTGVTPGGTATRIPNPWTASSTLATHRGASSTGVAGPTETPPILSNGGAKTVVSVWAVGVAVLVGLI